MSPRAAVLAFVLVAFADSSAAPQTPTFRSGVDLVRFDVRVVDENGRPITDLQPEELEIYENGKRLPVMLFQGITEPAESFVDAALRAVSAEVSSNSAFPRGHLYILVFDQQHITAGNEQRARLAAEQFIRKRIRPTDRVAIFAIPGPGPQLGFTADRLKAISALSSIRGSYERVVTTPVGTLSIFEAHRVVQGDEKLIAAVSTRMVEQAGADSALAIERRGGFGGEDPSITRRVVMENARTVVNQTDAASRQFLQRLADVVAGFRDIEGRKTVVLFSEGFFQDNLSRELETVAAAAAQSYCVFHSIDLNPRSASLNEAQASDTNLATETQARIAPMATLAVETDGVMIVDASARSGEALDRLAEQAQDYYLVGFTPSEQARLDRGKYRRVTVRIKRAGARASARTGYALKPEPTSASRRQAIDSALGAPFVQQSLKVDYTTYVLRAAEAGRHKVVLSLDADLPVRSKPAETADAVFVVRDTRDGRVVASGTDTIALPAAARAGAALGSGSWRVHFDVPAGSYMMRAVVREPGGLVGSADRRIEIRPLDGPDVSVSDLVLGSALGGLPVRANAYTADGLSGVLETYGRTLVQLEGLDVRVELRRVDGHPVAGMSADLRETAPHESGGISRRATFVMPLESVPPGAYVAHAIVKARGEIVAERTRQVDVLAGASGASGAAEPADVVPPIEVLRGDLAQRYLTTLLERAQGTPLADAARRAGAGHWSEAELGLKRAGAAGAGVVYEALTGLALFAREEYAGAAAALERARAAEPANALTAFFLGWAHDGAGDRRAAIGAWRNAALLDPRLVSAHLALAEAYLKLAQPALAAQALRAGLTALPSSPELLARLAQIEKR